MDLKNKTIIIIGASSGMGFATAKYLHNKGANVVMVARDNHKLKKKGIEIDKNLENLTLVAADMTSENGRKQIIDAVPNFDHLVITAADLAYMPFKDFTLEGAMKIVNSKLIAPFFIAQLAAEKISSKGSIVFTSGIAAERPMKGGALTGAVNAALNSLVRGLALEVAPIRVNAISPGWTETPIWETVMPDEEKRTNLIKSMADKIPVGRIGESQDVAKGIEALLTNDFINAAVLDINGGQQLV